MKNSPSRDLFERVLAEGLSYLEHAVTSRTSETYYLEFKTTQESDYSGKRSLLDADKKNYAKNISAFGNSEGGVIVWGIRTGSADADYAVGKVPIVGVSNFLSLLDGFTSTLTTPPHASVQNVQIIEDESRDTGYVLTHIPKSNKRPIQVLNAQDFRYYLRAGSVSAPAPDTFLRSLFGQEPQPEVFITWGVSPVEIVDGDTVKFTVGMVLHNGGENVAKNLNGYVHIGGRDTALEALTPGQFNYNKNSISGMKIGFTAKPDFILGIEQEVQPILIHISIKPPITEHGIMIRALVNASNQSVTRLEILVPYDELQRAYEACMTDQSFDIARVILGKEDSGVEDLSDLK